MSNIEVACVHWSGWHPTAENDRRRGKGWTEWEYLKRAQPRFVGHRQPLVPLWGYFDDSLTENAAMQVDAAADAGITSWLYVWGWSPNTPEVGHPTIDAFLRAGNRERLRFELMWCAGVVEDMEACADYMIARYFSQPNYLHINGGPFVAIYELFKFVRENGGVEAALAKLDTLRRRVREAGMGELQLVAMEWGIQACHAADFDGDINGFLERAGCVGMTSYTWAHNVYPCGYTQSGERTDDPAKAFYGMYEDWARGAEASWTAIQSEHPAFPYWPNISTGWDPSPRCPPEMVYKMGGPLMYHLLSGGFEILHTPYLSPIVHDATPEKFERELRAAKEYLEKTDMPVKLCTLYAWNEWSEGGHLEPDQYFGYGWLNAIRRVFGK